MECSLELLDQDLLVALQDLGAAGLTSSSSEMAAKGGVGIDLDVRRVPLREADMEPFEIMISESQERMLCVVAPELVDDVLAVCAKWEVNAHRDRRGHVVGPAARVRRRGAGRRSARERARRRVPGVRPRAARAEPAALPAPAPVIAAVLGRRDAARAAVPANLASRSWAFEQYDCVVGSRTCARPEQADARPC